jgi:DNA-binding MarR family transcriptional regulator
MLVIQLMDFKWDERAPFPSVGRLAKRMGLTPRAVRAALRSLETSGFIKREYSHDGGPNRYHFGGLFAALERLLGEKTREAA